MKPNVSDIAYAKIRAFEVAFPRLARGKNKLNMPLQGDALVNLHTAINWRGGAGIAHRDKYHRWANTLSLVKSHIRRREDWRGIGRLYPDAPGSLQHRVNVARLVRRMKRRERGEGAA